MSESGMGKIELIGDFCGPEYPILSLLAVNAATGGGQSIGPFHVYGDLADADAGVVALSIVGGAVRLTGTNEAEKGCALTTDLIFSVPLNGPLVLEARVQTQALTARNFFIGFCGTLADDIAPPLASSTETHTLTATDLIGFHIDSSLTAGATWHAVFNGGTTAGQTVSTSTTTGVVAVTGEYDVLRVEIDPNGTCRFFVNGNLESTVANGSTVTSTDLLAAIVGCCGTTTTITDLDVDYMKVTAQRDWTR